MLNQRCGIVGVVDGEITFKAEFFHIYSQYFGKNGVERTHPQFGSHLFTHESRNTLTHFTCCLVGESERQNLMRFVAVLQQVHNFISQHTGFAGAGSGNHQLGTTVVFHSLPLLGIEM